MMLKNLLRAAVALTVAMLTGCAQMSHVASGDAVVKDRMLVTVERAWNQFQRAYELAPLLLISL